MRSLQDCGNHVAKLVDKNYLQSSDQGGRVVGLIKEENRHLVKVREMGFPRGLNTN